MRWLSAFNTFTARWVITIASVCLAALGAVVIYGVVMRYVFNRPPDFVEEGALLLVISVAMFGAASSVRESGHIGLDSLVIRLSPRLQFFCSLAADVLVIAFSVALFIGSLEMMYSTGPNTIPILGISEAFRYAAPLAASVLIVLYSLEHLVGTCQKFVGSK